MGVCWELTAPPAPLLCTLWLQMMSTVQGDSTYLHYFSFICDDVSAIFVYING